MCLILIDKNQYINGLNVDAVNKQAFANEGTKISVAVSQNWFDVHPDYSRQILQSFAGL